MTNDNLNSKEDNHRQVNWKRIRKPVAFLVLLLGAIFIYYQYKNNIKTYNIKFLHYFHKYNVSKNIFLSGEIFNNAGELIWKGEYRTHSSHLSHKIKLPKGRYKAVFHYSQDRYHFDYIRFFRSDEKVIKIHWKKMKKPAGKISTQAK